MIRSNALRDSAGHHDARCMLEIAGVHQSNAGCVLAHIRIAGECGGAQKPDDTHAVLACCACHDALDGRTPGLRNGSGDWHYYAHRGMARTIRWWFEHGFISIKGAK
jgi:hypothetical protein